MQTLYFDVHVSNCEPLPFSQLQQSAIVESIYYCDVPRRPTSISPHIKVLKSDLEKFCNNAIVFGKFSSLKGN